MALNVNLYYHFDKLRLKIFFFFFFKVIFLNFFFFSLLIQVFTFINHKVIKFLNYSLEFIVSVVAILISLLIRKYEEKTLKKEINISRVCTLSIDGIVITPRTQPGK